MTDQTTSAKLDSIYDEQAEQTATLHAIRDLIDERLDSSSDGLEWLPEPKPAPRPATQEGLDEALAEAMYNVDHGDGEVFVWSNTSEFERDLYRDLARAAREHIEAEKSKMGAALYYGAPARARAEEAERRVDELEPALARSETERDEWKAKHAALRAAVQVMLAHAEPDPWEDLRLRRILDRDAARTPQADPDTVTLRRDDVIALAKVWHQHAREQGDAKTTARVRAALEWG